jgi:hypothetical protein
MDVQKFNSRKSRPVETGVGILLICASVAGSLFFGLDKTISLAFVGLGGVMISKAKVFEFLKVLKENLPSIKVGQ